MNPEELIKKIATIKGMIDAESDADIKARYKVKQAKLEKDLSDSEAAIALKEAKVEKKEEKQLSAIDEKIKNLKDMIQGESNPAIKAKYQAKLDMLEGKTAVVKEEIKEEKKVVKEHKEEIKEAVKEVVKEAKTVKEKAVKKEAVKKVAEKHKERKKVVAKKVTRSKKLQALTSELDNLINKNKQLKAKYKGKGVDLERDAARSAKPFGYRFKGKGDYRDPVKVLSAEQLIRAKKRGIIDYEDRPNRSDKYGTKGAPAKGHPKLAKGGSVGSSHEDGMREAKPTGLRYKNEAVGVMFNGKKITDKDLFKHPSKAFAEKHPDLVYTENRLNKADKKPSKKFMSY